MGNAAAEAVMAAGRGSSSPQGNQYRLPGSTERERVKLETIQAVLDQCQRALKLLEEPDLILDTDPDVSTCSEGKEKPPLSFSTADSDADVKEQASILLDDDKYTLIDFQDNLPDIIVVDTLLLKNIHAFSKRVDERKPFLALRLQAVCPVVNLRDYENDFEEMEENMKLCEMVKSRVESQSFLEKLGSMHVSVSQSDSAWEMVGTADFWENKQFGAESKDDVDGYVLVNQEDIVEGIVSFMATYILSLKEAKELSPNQLQKALSKTFSVKKKKSKLMKAWEGSQVIYNVASWGATAVGIYQNPAIIKAASVAILSSCRAISKFL